MEGRNCRPDLPAGQHHRMEDLPSRASISYTREPCADRQKLVAKPTLLRMYAIPRGIGRQFEQKFTAYEPRLMYFASKQSTLRFVLQKQHNRRRHGAQQIARIATLRATFSDDPAAKNNHHDRKCFGRHHNVHMRTPFSCLP